MNYRWIIQLRTILLDNKIYFETIAATFLSAMAIIVSVFQYTTSKDQNKILKNQSILLQMQSDVAKQQLILTDEQLKLTQKQYNNSQIYESVQIDLAKKQNSINQIQGKLASEQLSESNKNVNLHRVSNWMDLKKIWLEALEIKNVLKYNKLSKDDKTKILDNLCNLLISQEKNPLILEDKECLQKWRLSITLTKDICDRYNEKKQNMYFSKKIAGVAIGNAVDSFNNASITQVFEKIEFVIEKLMPNTSEIEGNLWDETPKGTDLERRWRR